MNVAVRLQAICVATLGIAANCGQQASVTGPSLAAKRTMATLLAWLALLCAQVAALPGTGITHSQTTAIAAPTQLAVARVEGGAALVKADRSSSHAKPGASLDFVTLRSAEFDHPERSELAPVAIVRRQATVDPTLPYRARAPPALTRTSDLSNFS